MAKFEITAPDGGTYEVTAPDDATEQQVKRFAFREFASSMDPTDLSIARSKNDEFGEYLREQAMKKREGETDAERFKRLYGGLPADQPGVLEGTTRGYLQGATFGSGDEIVAGTTAALAHLAGKYPDRTMGELYDAYGSRERGKVKQFRDDHPVLAYGSEIAGALPTAIAASPTMAGLSFGGKLATGAATGTAQGGLYGYLSGEDHADRLKSAAAPAAFGGAVGAAAPVVGAGARNVVEWIQAARAARAAGVPAAAQRVVQRAAAADDALTGEGAQRVAQAGDDAMLADAGTALRELLDTAMQTSGKAASRARKAIEQRAKDAGATLTSALDDAFGIAKGIKSTETALRRGSAAARNETYQAAYAKPVNYASDVGQMIDDIVKNRLPASALRSANKLMRVSGERSRQILFELKDGIVTFRQMPDVRQLDYITRGLGQVADAENAKGMLGGTTDIGRAYAVLKTELRQLLREAVPEYGVALDTAADPISKRAALLLGEKLLSSGMRRDEIAERLVGLSAAEKGYVAQGVRSQIDDAMANVQRALTDPNMEAREAIKAIRMITTRSSREKLDMLLGSDKAGQLFGKIDEALSAFELRAAVNTNSKTFARLALDEAIERQTKEGVINAIRAGEPTNIAKRPWQVITGYTPAARQRATDRTYDAIADHLTGPRGNQALDALRQMAKQEATAGPRIERAGRIAEQLAQSNVGVTGPLPAMPLPSGGLLDY